MQSPWRIELLGWLRAEMDEHVVTRFSTHHTAALLARLALWPRRAHTREELVELLWPEADTDAARGRLRQALASLRRQLEPPGIAAGSVLITDRTHIRLNPAAISTDVADFEAAVRAGHLAEAITLYTGELLPGFYEDWVMVERERLEARFEEIQEIESEHRPLHAGVVPEGSTAAGGAAPEDRPVLRLPLQFTRFFGRQTELEQISRLLTDHRLVTLTGPGGTGKTRLAIEAARQCPAESRSIVFVELSEVGDGGHLAEVLADGLRLPRDDPRPALERLTEALSRRPTLLVLDNLEQVAAHAGPLALNLLTRVPSLRLLVTSRRRLHIAGEREYPVPALPLPLDNALPEEMARTAAVQLFVDRAQTVRPDFQLMPRNAGDIAALCRRLEGLPLALELAAARASTLTPAQMNTRLAQRFELLATRRTDKDARHRSLWAAIAWSVDLLPEALQRFWRRLSVFRDGCTAESAAAVTGDSAALESLTQLRERSLIQVDDSGGGDELRFRLLDSLREFGQEQMSAPDQDECAKQHGAYFLGLAQESEEKLRGPEQAAWLERLEREHNNIRAALTHGVREQNAEFTQRLAGALWGFWERHGHLKEAHQWLEEVLRLRGPETDTAQAARAIALNRFGAILNIFGDMERAAQVHRETLETYQQLGDNKGIALAWNRLGVLASQQGHHAEAQAAFSEALARERELGNRFNMAAALVNLGILAQYQCQWNDALAYCEEGLALFQELEHFAGVADVLFNLASIYLDKEAWDQALSFLYQAGERYETLGDRWSRAYVDYGLAAVARHQQRWEDAKHLAQEALAVCLELGDQGKVADIFSLLGMVALSEGEIATALTRLREALQLHHSLGNSRGTALCLRELAVIAAANRHFLPAARLLGASTAWQEKSGLTYIADPQRSEDLRHTLLQAMGNAGFHQAHDEGYARSTDTSLWDFVLSDARGG